MLIDISSFKVIFIVEFPLLLLLLLLLIIVAVCDELDLCDVVEIKASQRAINNRSCDDDVDES